MEGKGREGERGKEDEGEGRGREANVGESLEQKKEMRRKGGGSVWGY